LKNLNGGSVFFGKEISRIAILKATKTFFFSKRKEKKRKEKKRKEKKRKEKKRKEKKRKEKNSLNSWKVILSCFLLTESQQLIICPSLSDCPEACFSCQRN